MIFVIDKFIRDQLGVEELDEVKEEEEVGGMRDRGDSFAKLLPQNSSVSSKKVDVTPSSSFLLNLLRGLRNTLLRRFETFASNQVDWLIHQSADPKKTGVFAPFLKLPAFIDQLYV